MTFLGRRRGQHEFLKPKLHQGRKPFAGRPVDRHWIHLPRAHRAHAQEYSVLVREKLHLQIPGAMQRRGHAGWNTNTGGAYSQVIMT